MEFVMPQRLVCLSPLTWQEDKELRLAATAPEWAWMWAGATICYHFTGEHTEGERSNDLPKVI